MVIRYILGIILAGWLCATAQGMDMHHGAETEWTRADDAAFLYGMIAHHKGAIDMSMMLVDSKDPQVSAWARSIIKVQDAEILMMQGLLDNMELPDATGAAKAMEREMREMMDHRLSDNEDVNFVSMMMPHHAGAIVMSTPALVGSGDPVIRGLARDIITAQAEEIFDFRQWLDKNHAR